MADPFDIFEVDTKDAVRWLGAAATLAKRGPPSGGAQRTCQLDILWLIKKPGRKSPWITPDWNRLRVPRAPGEPPRSRACGKPRTGNRCSRPASNSITAVMIERV